jgi:DNA-directed RNA polymerase subunit omega
MINPSIVELLEVVDNRYSLVTVVSKRARQLIEGKKPLIVTSAIKPVTVATKEIMQGELTYKTVKEGVK